MLYGLLNLSHPDLDLDGMAAIKALYLGGDYLEDYIGNFITQTPTDDGASYQRKLKKAINQYVNHLGLCLNYYVGFLFAYPIDTVPIDNSETPPFYQHFKENADGHGTDFQDFIRQSFTQSLLYSKSYIWVKKPILEKANQEEQAEEAAESELSQEEWEKLGLDQITLQRFDADDVKDWHCDESGELEWILFKECERIRPSLKSSGNLVRETFYYLNESKVDIYQIIYDLSDPPDEEDLVPLVDSYLHGFERVPIVEMDCNSGLWLGMILKSPAIANLEARFKAAWVSTVSANSVPVVFTETEDLRSLFGKGNAIRLGPTDDFKWTVPPSDHHQLLLKEVQYTEESIYKSANLLHEIGQSQSSYSLVRSGMSRMIDVNSGHIRMKSYAHRIREAVENIYQLIAEARGEEMEWNVLGFEQLDELDLPQLVEVGTGMKQAPVKSLTFQKEFQKRVAAQALKDLDEVTKETIRREIDAQVEEPPPVETGAGASKPFVMNLPKNGVEKPPPAVS